MQAVDNPLPSHLKFDAIANELKEFVKAQGIQQSNLCQGVKGSSQVVSEVKISGKVDSMINHIPRAMPDPKYPNLAKHYAAVLSSKDLYLLVVSAIKEVLYEIADPDDPLSDSE